MATGAGLGPASLRSAPARARVSAAQGDVALRNQMSRLQNVLVLAMLMIERGDEEQILHLVTTGIESFDECRVDGCFLTDSGWHEVRGPCTRPQVRADVEAQFAVLTDAGGAISIQGEPWGWAFPLRAADAHMGFLVVGAETEPSEADQFLLRVLAQETGVALANARVHRREQANAEELRVTLDALAESHRALERATSVHDRLTRVVSEGVGQQGIADALFELTGYPVSVEDAHGNVRAWSGPNQPDTDKKEPSARRAELLRRAELERQPLRDANRLLALAGAGDRRAVLVFHDDGAAGADDVLALEHGATVLALELARTQGVAENDLRLRHDLVDGLLTGASEVRVFDHAQALGYDLHRAHRVLAVAYDGSVPHDEVLFHAVRRAARETETGTLLLARPPLIVLLATTERQPARWNDFLETVERETGGMRCRVGIGGTCVRVADYPRSFRQAQLALHVQEVLGGECDATVFEDLGVYRLFGELTDLAMLEEFVQHWLGALLEYDAQKKSELILTLSGFLAAGGRYNVLADVTGMHRSTLKYRLQRIREISEHDLSDPDTVFNLQLATRARSILVELRDG